MRCSLEPDAGMQDGVERYLVVRVEGRKCSLHEPGCRAEVHEAYVEERDEPYVRLLVDLEREAEADCGPSEAIDEPGIDHEARIAGWVDRIRDYRLEVDGPVVRELEADADGIENRELIGDRRRLA